MKDRKKECTELAEDILRNIELSEIPLNSIVLKGLRLCRLLNDDDGIKIFTYEGVGYPTNENGKLTSEAWNLCGIMGRRRFEKDKDGNDIELAFTSTISELESTNQLQTERMKVAMDPTAYGDNVTPLAISRAKNTHERTSIVSSVQTNSKRLQTVKLKIYDYVLKLYNELIYGNIVEDIFRENRNDVDIKLKDICPDTIKKFSSVYDNLKSSSQEDWANAIHSCRRILKEVADVLYPATKNDIEVDGKKIKLGSEQYINRLIQYINSKSKSKTFSKVVGTTLNDIGNKLDALNNAVCKGTHDDISKKEAERYLIYTYLFLGDILNLKED